MFFCHQFQAFPYGYKVLKNWEKGHKKSLKNHDILVYWKCLNPDLIFMSGQKPLEISVKPRFTIHTMVGVDLLDVKDESLPRPLVDRKLFGTTHLG